MQPGLMYEKPDTALSRLSDLELYSHISDSD